MNVRAGNKEAECQKIDALELWCWRRLLRAPWTSRKSNQVILKEINPEYSLKGLMLKLKLQYFVYLMQRVNSLEKTLMLGKIEGRRWRDDRGWDGWMASPTQWTWVWADSVSGEEQWSLASCSPWDRKDLGTPEWLNNKRTDVMGVACFVFTLVKSPQEIRMHTVQNRFTEIENKLMVTKVDSGSGARR